MILKDLFNGKHVSIKDVDCWVVPQIEPFIEDEDGNSIGELKIDFGGCCICASRLMRVFFHTIRNGIKIECINYTDTQKAMIDFVYRDMDRLLNRLDRKGVKDESQKQ